MNPEKLLKNKDYPQQNTEKQDEPIIRFKVRGHPNVAGLHRTTLEFTKEGHLTPRGDCIIGLKSEIGCADLPEDTKAVLKSNAKFRVVLKTPVGEEVFTGFGHPSLKLNHPTDMVFRKSNYICGRTIMIRCNKAAADLDRKIIEYMRNPESIMEVEIYRER